MKQIVLVTKQNSVADTDHGRQLLTREGLAFVERTYPEDVDYPHMQMVPSFVIDIDGYAYDAMGVHQTTGPAFKQIFDNAPDTYTPPVSPPTPEAVLLAKPSAQWSREDVADGIKFLLLGKR